MVTHRRRTTGCQATTERGHQRRRWAAWVAVGLLPMSCLLGLSGCANFWDDVTSRDFEFHSLFSKPNPFVVLRDSEDGDKRAKALRALHEPKEHGGTDQDQAEVLKILSTAAVSERHPLCRLAAIKQLSEFKDPRAADALVAAYHQAGSSRPDPGLPALLSQNSYTPEAVTVIRCQAIAGLGKVKSQSGLQLLTLVTREPRQEGTEQEKQQALDLRIAAARALASYSQPEATQVLVTVLKSERDVALRDRATESLQAITGKELPADAVAWEDYLQHAPADRHPDTPFKVNLAGWFGGDK